MPLENVFSWSKSRDEEFRECQRKYYFDKYASWGGWDARSPEEARKAYILKNLKNRWAWKGETVHHVIEQTLKSMRSGKPRGLDAALRDLTDTMRADYRSSQSKKYLQEPKKSVGLFEHEYAKNISDAVWKKIHDESAACLRNFYGSALFAELSKDDAGSWLVIEDLEEYELEGTKIFVKLDFARKNAGCVEIYDWKTGKSNGENANVQIGTYVLYAMQKWSVPLEQIRAYFFNLTSPSPVPAEQPVTAELVDSTREFIRRSASSMRALLADPGANKPKAREEFKFTENTRLCDFCNFYKICEKWN